MNSLKKLWPYIAPYKVSLIAIAIFGFLMSASHSAVAVIVKYLFDEVFVNKDMQMLVLIPFGIVILYFIHGISRYYHLYLLKYTGEKVSTTIQKDLQSKSMRLNLSYYNNTESGGLISKILNDVTVVQSGLNILADLVREPITGILLLGWVLYLDWKLTIILFVVGPIIVHVLNRLAKSVRRHSFTQQETKEKMTSTLKESIDGIRVIQSFNLQEKMQLKFYRTIKDFLKSRKKIISRQESAGPISEFLVACAISGIFYYKGVQILNGTDTIGSFLSYLTAIGFLQPPIKKLQDGFIRLQETVASTQRVFEILNSNDVVPEPQNIEPFPQNWNTIEYRNVCFSYGETPILKNINLKVQKGEIVALVGESGSGKSTMVNLLERFFDPTSGNIFIDNIPIDQFSLKELRENVSLVSQDVFLFNESVKDNIVADKKTSQMSVEDAAQLANATSFINKTSKGFESSCGDRGSLFSGGEKQRLSIARAIYKDAPILILDEATSALDSASELEVQKGLDQLLKGRTAFVIAHRLSTIAKASRILHLKEGKIIEEGRHEELIEKNGPYKKLYENQMVLT